MNENKLGVDPIPRLLLQFGLPSVISMFVNSVYNLVDQIFIGQGVGKLGNAATNVTMPFVTISMAVAMMISIGSAANVGLNLGRKNQELAERVLATGFTLALISGLGIMILGQVFMEPMLRLFGATDSIMPYAVSYARIYLIGLPFTTIGMMLSDEIRTDGNPGYAMIAMLAGCIFNIICDPLFIFVFKWGVAGAAFASIMGQFTTMVMLLIKLRNMKTLTFRREYMKLSPKIVGTITSLGTSAFIMQVAALVQQILMNQQVKKFGELSIYGAETPIAVFGIIMRINGLMMSFLIGITSGSQPIFSYNYGAKKYDRVKQLTFTALVCCTTIAIIGETCFQLFPQQIINMFGTEDALYNEFAVRTLKTMTLLIFVMSIQFVASTYFQSTGKPMKATVLSLSRQVLFSMPLLFILPAIFTKMQGVENGIFGIMYMFPISDIFSVVLASVMLFTEIGKLNKEARGELTA